MSFPKRTVEPENVELKSYSTVELKPESNEENSAVAQQIKTDVESQQSMQEIPEIVVHPSKDISPSKSSGWKETTVPSASPTVSQIAPVDKSTHDVFIELLQLDSSGLFWKEKARWIKYEENVEPSGNWGRPFLSYIDCESLRQLKRCLHEGLVALGSVNDGAFNISHTISNMLVLGGYAEPRHRVRLQQIMALPRMHQGESHSRFRKKVQLRRQFLKIANQKRQELFARAWELTENVVRNRWVRLARMALDQHRKQNPETENVQVQQSAREWCPENYLFGQNGVFPAASDSHLLKTGTDRLSVASEFSDVSYLRNLDFEAIQARGLPMTRDQIKLKKILHANTKGVLVLHACVDFLKRDEFVSAFIRYPNEKPIVDCLEVNLPVKILYILFTSRHTIRSDGYQICRTMGTLFHDKVFRRSMEHAKSCDDITNAFFMFIDGSVMLPPGNWKAELLTPIAGAISEIARKKHALRKFKHRDGNQLWKIVRTKVRVIAMMKDMLRSKESEKMEIVDIAREHEQPNTKSLFPKRGDCPLMNKFCEIRRRIKRKHCSRREKKLQKNTTNHDDDDDDDESSSDDEELKSSEVHPLHSDGRWFGGLRRELRKRYPLYWSDIKDGFHIQCLATIFYLAISLIAMCLTYGQVISKYTKGYIGASEMLFGTAISCILMAVLGTEPLSVIAGTAAMMIFESSTYQVSNFMGLNFMQVRWLTGMWIFLFLLLILAFDKTHWIHYCTRFTEEILHVLVALLFMYEGIKNLVKVYDENPLREKYIPVYNSSSKSGQVEKPNTALLYTILMFATFGLALGFRLFEKTRFFSPRIRRLLNFFSIPVAVNVMNAVVYAVDVHLDPIHIPERLQLTSPHKRDRVILPDHDELSQGNVSYWIILISIGPALLTVILLFIESEVTLLDCFKETRGRKGSGFHVNLLVVAIMVLISSFLGLPWMCLAAVETSVHLDSLKVWSSFDAPGVKSHVVKIREQRVTLFFTGILVGLSSLLDSYLGHIPEAVFSGMVLYMGVVALFGVQMIERFFLMFMAPGQHPDIPYLKNVPLSKVYLFTIIQVGCVVILWVVKSFKTVSSLFPLFVLLMIPLRVLLGRVFNQEHMEQLDNEEDEEGHGPLD